VTWKLTTCPLSCSVFVFPLRHPQIDDAVARPFEIEFQDGPPSTPPVYLLAVVLSYYSPQVFIPPHLFSWVAPIGPIWPHARNSFLSGPIFLELETRRGLSSSQPFPFSCGNPPPRGVRCRVLHQGVLVSRRDMLGPTTQRSRHDRQWRLIVSLTPFSVLRPFYSPTLLGHTSPAHSCYGQFWGP